MSDSDCSNCDLDETTCPFYDTCYNCYAVEANEIKQAMSEDDTNLLVQTLYTLKR